MAEARMIEMMARAITAVIADAHYNEEDFPDDAQRRQLRAEYIEKTWSFKLPQARAALSVLAANVSDEMVEAYTRSYYNGDEFLVREIMRNERDVQANKVAIAAALSAAGDEDRRA